MTAIAGIRTSDGRVFIGCDGESTWGWTKHPATKLLRIGGLRLACTGLAAVSIALKHRLTQPTVPEAAIDAYLGVTLPDAMKAALQAASLWDSNKGVRDGCAILVGFRSHLVSYDSWLAAHPVERGFMAHGTGGEVALGAMQALLAAGLDDHERVLSLAISAASMLSVGVGGKPQIEECPRLTRVTTADGITYLHEEVAP